MVRYADGPRAEVSVEIDAAPQQVWPLVADINLPAEFSREFQRAEWISSERGVGACFRGYNRHPAVGEWNVLCTVTAWERERAFEWVIGDVDNRTARWRFDLSPSGNGSILRFSAEMGPGPSGLTSMIARMPEREEKLVANRLAEWTENMERTVNGYRDRAETTSDTT